MNQYKNAEKCFWNANVTILHRWLQGEVSFWQLPMQLVKKSNILFTKTDILMAPSHYLNQYWLIFKGVMWHSYESIFAMMCQCVNLWWIHMLNTLPYTVSVGLNMWIIIQSIDSGNVCHSTRNWLSQLSKKAHEKTENLHIDCKTYEIHVLVEILANINIPLFSILFNWHQKCLIWWAIPSWF